MSNDTQQEDPIAAKLAELQEKHPDAEVVETKDRPELTVIVRPPNSSEWKHAKSLLFDKQTRADGNRQLVNDCLLFPDSKSAEFLKLANRFPGWVDGLGDVVSNLGGSNFEVSVRKR